MVKYWHALLDKSIAITKARIRHHEKHGCGNNVIQDKLQLKKQERLKELRHEELHK